MELDGKVALVTGASRGVGRAVALALARKGCAVALNYQKSADQAALAAQEIGGTRALCVAGDVASDEDCRRIVQETAGKFGRLDILVNNAGTTEFIPHHDLEAVQEEHWNRILGVNLKGPFQCARAAAPFLAAHGDGAIVNVASVAAISGVGSSIPYCASKAALLNLTLTLARVLGPSIRVNAVAPGFIEGDWLRSGLGADYEAVRQAHEKRAVLGKVCRPEDVAEAILSFITGSRLITGQTLVCDGGMLIGPPPPEGRSAIHPP